MNIEQGVPITLTLSGGSLTIGKVDQGVGGVSAWIVSSKNALTASSPTFATVGVASASAVAANSSRKGLVLINTSSNTISLGFGAAAVLNSGITLAPGSIFVMDEYLYNTSAVNAIASSASSNLSIQEYT